MGKVVQLPELEVRPVTSDMAPESDALACEPSKPSTASLPAVVTDAQTATTEPAEENERRLVPDSSLTSLGDGSMSARGSYRSRGKSWSRGRSLQLPPVRRCFPLTSVLDPNTRPSMPYS